MDNIITKIKEKMAHAGNLKARIKLNFGDDGILLIDTTQTPATLSQEDGEADTTLICSLSTFKAILDGTQDPNIAFMMGKLKIKGSMGIAMKLNGILEN